MGTPLRDQQILTREVVAKLNFGPVEAWKGDYEGVQGTGEFEDAEPEAVCELVRRTLAARSSCLYSDLIIDLCGLRELSEETADALAGLGSCDWACIALDGIAELTTPAATLLARFRDGRVCLNGIRRLSDATAGALGESAAAWMNLNGLTELSPGAAAALARFRGELSLDGLTSISDSVANALALGQASCLSLNGLTVISPASAYSLARNENVHFTAGLTHVTAEVAEALVSVATGLILPRLTRLDLGTLAILAGCEGRLALDGLETMGDSEARVLSTHRGGLLSLNGLLNVTEEALALLCNRADGLRLGLRTVTDASARLMASGKGALFLPRLAALSNSEANVALAAKLSKDVGSWGFASLRDVSAEAAECLARCESPWLRLDGLTSLSVGVARNLANHRGFEPRSHCCGISLEGLTTLPPDVATALSGYTGSLKLSSVSELCQSSALALSLKRGPGTVYLPALKVVSESSAELLTGPKFGNLSIPDQLRITDLRRVASGKNDHDREFIVGFYFSYCRVEYRGYRIMKRELIRKLVLGLDSGAEIETENMPKHWVETFNVELLAESFWIHSGKQSDISAMRSLFGDSVGSGDYFHAVLEAAEHIGKATDSQGLPDCKGANS